MDVMAPEAMVMEGRRQRKQKQSSGGETVLPEATVELESKGRRQKKLKQSSMVLPEAMIIEVLLRFSLKYVLRCKCVSKTWCSLISSSDIMKLYYSRNLGIFISHYGCFKQTRLSLGGTPPFTKQFDDEYEVKFTQVCFYTSAGDLTLCNSYNFETMKLPLPSFYNRLRYDRTQFYLGFDPFNGQYVLLAEMKYFNYHSIWIRRHAPSIFIHDQFMYWLVELYKDNRREILVFNLAGGISTNFFSIPLPPHFDQLSTSATLVKFTGRLAVGCRTTELNIWELDMLCYNCTAIPLHCTPSLGDLNRWELGRLRYW
ncbi:hypothetical protein RND71_015667 [Anisodus tanguticus]|uniref:F-box domain-containing protein n=1 Tax=Anisodus tanguticus TaxID=243964 RepID=A0AAE1S7A4_9SOLA|nr:hypothetical protein RND71_015667 [Anisodus tanguticus]